MEKVVWIFERGVSRSLAPGFPLLQQMIERLKPNPTVKGLSLNVLEGDPLIAKWAPHYETAADARQLVGVASVWLTSLDQRSCVDLVAVESGLRWYSYLVTESVPLDYASNQVWQPGIASAGVTLVAAFRKPDNIAREEFFSRWYGHTPLSLEVHPLFRYLRNTVSRALTENSPLLDGIVEERVRNIEDLDPEVFYSGRKEEVGADFASFVDLDRADAVRISLMREYILKVPWNFCT